jgi:hypothetical protein
MMNFRVAGDRHWNKPVVKMINGMELGDLIKSNIMQCRQAPREKKSKFERHPRLQTGAA